MSEEQRYTLEEAHTEFAKLSNGQVWKLLGKTDRSPEEDEEMLRAAFASLYHWTYAGTEIHQQRGEWMIAHVYSVLGNAGPAIKHAQRCLELTETHKDQMQDFDIAYAYEGMARANALAGDAETAKKYLELAKATGESIADAEDKEWFVGDLAGGDWYGVE
jgi:tetratricopeptide (TPR) repeat protein